MSSETSSHFSETEKNRYDVFPVRSRERAEGKKCENNSVREGPVARHSKTETGFRLKLFSERDDLCEITVRFVSSAFKTVRRIFTQRGEHAVLNGRKRSSRGNQFGRDGE